MNRTALATLAGLAVTAAVALQFERVVAVGAVGGYLFGAGISLLGVAWQSHLARVRPKDVMQGTVGSFLVQLFSLMLAFLSLRYVEPVAALADWQAFLLAFASASFVCLVFGSLDTARLLKAGLAPSLPQQHPVQKGQAH